MKRNLTMFLERGDMNGLDIATVISSVLPFSDAMCDAPSGTFTEQVWSHAEALKIALSPEKSTPENIEASLSTIASSKLFRCFRVYDCGQKIVERAQNTADEYTSMTGAVHEFEQWEASLARVKSSEDFAVVVATWRDLRQRASASEMLQRAY